MRACDMEQPPHAGCIDCPLFTESGGYVPPFGNLTASLAIVGEAPGAEEAREGRPFVGASGQLQRRVMWQAGLQPDEALWTNSVACRPPGNRTPTPLELEACAPHLNDLLARSDATVVLAIGAVAAHRLLGDDLIKKITGPRAMKACWDGYIYTPEMIPKRAIIGRKHGRFGEPIAKGKNKGLLKMSTVPIAPEVVLPPRARGVITSLHPAGVQRGWTDLPKLSSAMLRVREALEGYPIIEPENVITDFKVFRGALEKSEFHAVAFDIENPKDFDYKRITDISFATSSGLLGSFRWNPEVRHLAQEILGAGKTWTLVAHNSPHDVTVLKKHGTTVDTSRVECSMMMAYLDEPDLRKGLGHVAPRFILTTPWKHLADQDMTLYNAKDALITIRIWELLRMNIEANEQIPLLKNIVMPAVTLLPKLTQIGIAIDMNKKNDWLKAMQQELTELRAKWAAQVPGVEYSSPVQLIELFHGKMGLPVVKRTPKTQRPSMDEEALEKLFQKTGTPLAKLIIDLRGLEKNISTYNENLAIGIDGCIHPSYLPAGKDEFVNFGASSLRLAAFSPNIQNQPHVARYMYVPHKKGRVIWACDYSQIEARLVAVFARDRDLLKLYDEGVDLHQRTADYLTRILGRPVDRPEAKSYRHGLNYGMGYKLLAEHAGIPQGIARVIVHAFRNLEPLVYEWQEQTARFAAKHGYVENPFKFRRNFPGFADYESKTKHSRNAAINVGPQSTVAVIMLDLMPIIDAALRAEFPGPGIHAGAFLLTQAHDEMVGECEAKNVPRVQAIVQGIMEREWPELDGWHCPTNFTCGPNWAACKDYEAKGKKLKLSPVDTWISEGEPTW